MAITEQEYRAGFGSAGFTGEKYSPEIANSIQHAVGVVYATSGYWNAQGGPNTREDILNDMIRAGFNPEVASQAIYTILQDNGQVNESYLPQEGEDAGSFTQSGTQEGFTQQQLDDAAAAHNRSVKSIENAYSAGLLTFKQKQKLIDESRDEILTQKDRGIEDLGRSRDQGIQSNSGFFNQISPDAFQSQQGVYNKKVTDEFDRGETDILNQYNKGVSTLDDNQTTIDLAKGHFEEANAAALADEAANYRNQTGAFTGDIDYTAQLNATSTPNLSTYNPIAYNANPAGFSARPAPQSPNAVVGKRNPTGAQGSAANQEDIDKYLYG